MNDLIKALKETTLLLDRSENSDWTRQTVAQIKEVISENIKALETDGTYQKRTLGVMFAPTGSIQETAIWNGWPDEYERLASIVDLYT